MCPRKACGGICGCLHFPGAGPLDPGAFAYCFINTARTVSRMTSPATFSPTSRVRRFPFFHTLPQIHH